MKRIRRKLFYGFVLLFLVTAPLSLLYTAGFRWTKDGGLLKTGTLLLATTPRGATITVDGRKRSDLSPSIVKRLRPGKHAVRMEFPGHQPWEKTVTIKSGETSFAEAVVLFSDDEPQKSVLRSFDRATLNPSSSRVAWMTTQHGWTEVWVTTESGADARLVHRATTQDMLKLRWEDDDHVAVLSQNGAPMRIDVRDGRNTTPSFPITLKDEDTATLVRASNGDTLARLPKTDYWIVEVRSPYILLEQPFQGRIVLIDESDKKTPLHLVESALFYEWIGPHTLLYADAYSIQLYNTDTHRSTTLTRLSQPLVAIHWTIRHPGYVFYATEREAFALEINELGNRLISSLGTLTAIDDMGTDETGHILYLLGRDALDAGMFVRPLFHRSSPNDEMPQSAEIEIQDRVHEIFQEDAFNILRFNPTNHVRKNLPV